MISWNRRRVVLVISLLLFTAGLQVLHQEKSKKEDSPFSVRKDNKEDEDEIEVVVESSENAAFHESQQRVVGYKNNNDVAPTIASSTSSSSSSLNELRNYRVPERQAEKWANIDNKTCRYDYENLDDATMTLTSRRNNHDDDGSPEPLYEWQRRAPYAIIIGTMKGGTTALNAYLTSHDKIFRRQGWKEEHFFGPGKMGSFRQDKRGIPVIANQQAYASRFQNNYPDFWQDGENHTIPHPEGRLAIDDTPGYMLWSDRVPDAIACVAPWAKLIATVRNPTDRVASHYRFLFDGKRSSPDWENWIGRDIAALKKAGFLQNWNEVDFDSFAGSELETLAWKRYLRQGRKEQYPVGRSLYAIQLQHYYESLARRGRPKSDMFVIVSEDMKNDTQGVVSQVFDFLDLPPHILNDASPKHETNGRSTPMPDSVRETLKDLFAPYNRRLFNMLGRENIWD